MFYNQSIDNDFHKQFILKKSETKVGIKGRVSDLYSFHKDWKLGYNHSELGRKYGISKKTVINLIKQIKDKEVESCKEVIVNPD